MSALDTLQRSLAERYTIERELGRGATAIVYLAHDVKHNRQVAIKVLNPELALAVRAERFLREIQIAAQLNHPNILPVYDSGQAGDFLYYVMPVVSESLRDRLRREQQLPLEDALAIAREVAEALGYAHQQGIVHRDIKPENVLLNQGHALVADFGIARALTAAGGEGLTDGIALGTPAYMSPEQGSASPQVDARSDLYALGCVLYEMLVGHTPFTGTSAQEILARHALDAPPSLKAARPDITDGLQSVVMKLLAKVPAARFANTAAFRGSLESATLTPHGRIRPSYALLILVVLVGIGTLTAWVTMHSPGQSLAVLPFESLVTDSSELYFAEGMTDEIGSALNRLPGLRVVPVKAAYLARRAGDASPRTIGRDLNVRYLLEGTVRKAGNRIRVTPRLVRASDGTQLWVDNYDGELQSLFALQERFARDIAGELRVKLAPGSDAIVPRPTHDPEASNLYRQGRYWLESRGGPVNMRKAIGLFQDAVARDSAYSLAYSGLADAYMQAGQLNYVPPAEAFVQGEAASRRALELDSSSSAAHAAFSRALLLRLRDTAGAEAELRRAIRLDPNNSAARMQYANILAQRGHSDESLEQATRAQQGDPTSTLMNGRLGDLYLWARRPREAIPWLQAAVDLEPGAVIWVGRLGNAYGQSGDRVQALAMLNRLRSAPQTQELLQPMAQVYAGMGERDSAFAYLERARAAGYPFIAAQTHPQWDRIRSDPRWPEFLQRIRRKG